MYKPAYKCRICDEIFSSEYDDSVDNICAAALKMGEIQAKVNFGGHEPVRIHECANTSIGRADFVGYIPCVPNKN